MTKFGSRELKIIDGKEYEVIDGIAHEIITDEDIEELHNIIEEMGGLGDIPEDDLILQMGEFIENYEPLIDMEYLKETK